MQSSSISFPKPYADFVARLRVPVGFLLALAFLYFAAPTPRSLAAGIPIAFAGLLLRAWAAGHLAKNQQLAETGPYAYTRNPLYLGTALAAAGLVIASRQIALAALFAAAFLFVYLPVIELEEQHLRNLFANYAEYAARVPRFGIRWPAARPKNSFQFALYINNREYQAMAGFIAGLVILAWKAWR